MGAPTERNLAFAKEAASTAIFRLLAVLLAFGALELIETLGRALLAYVLLGAARQSPLPSGLDMDGPLQLPFVTLGIAISAIKLAALVIVFRRRAERSGRVAVLVAMGVVGIACRTGTFVVGFVQTAALARRSTEALAIWSMASSVANTVTTSLDSLMLVGVFVAAAVATIRDRVPDEKPATYRRAPME